MCDKTGYTYDMEVHTGTDSDNEATSGTGRTQVASGPLLFFSRFI